MIGDKRCLRLIVVIAVMLFREFQYNIHLETWKTPKKIIKYTTNVKERMIGNVKK